MSQVSTEYEIEIIFDPYAQGEDGEPFYEGAIYLTIEVEGSASRYIPARTYGDPGDCYPEEGGEVEVSGFRAISAKTILPETPVDVSGVTSGDIEWLLSEFDMRRIEDQIAEAAVEERDCNRYDEWRDREQDDYYDYRD